jgi:hypothetical protein
MLKYNPGRGRRNGIKAIIPGVLVLMVFSRAFLQGAGPGRRGVNTFATESIEVTEKKI